MNNIDVGLGNIIVGLLLIILCVPLVKRKIKMNKWYGMRYPEAFKSEEDWYRINEYGGRIFIYWTIPSVLIGVIVLFLPPLGNTAIKSLLRGSIAVTTVMAIIQFHYSKKS